MIDNKNTDVMIELSRGSFRRTVSRVSKASPLCKNLWLVIKKKSDDMVIMASPDMTEYKKYYEDASPHFDVCATVHNVKNAVPLKIMVNKIALTTSLEKVRHSDEEKLFLSIEGRFLHLCFAYNSAHYSVKLPIDDIEIANPLKTLIHKKYVDEIQIEDFYKYFRETRHVLAARLKKDLLYYSFCLEIDSENNIRVLARSVSHISVRGYITGDIKHKFVLLKSDMVRTVSLFDKETVTICIPKKDDNHLHLFAKDTAAAIPVINRFSSSFRQPIDKLINEKPLLTLIFEKEKLFHIIKEIMGFDGIPRFIVKGKILEAFCGIEDGVHPTGHYGAKIVMEKSPDIDVSFQVEEKQLYDAVYSIDSYYIKFMFMPRNMLMVTDYHRSFRMLPHTLKSLEIIYLPRDSFHIL